MEIGKCYKSKRHREIQRENERGRGGNRWMKKEWDGKWERENSYMIEL